MNKKSTTQQSTDYPHDNNCECADDDFNGDGKIDFVDWIIFSQWIVHGKPGIKKLKLIMEDFVENPENELVVGSSPHLFVPVKIPKMTNADYEEKNTCVTSKDLAIYYAYSDWGADGERPEPDEQTLSDHINELDDPILGYSSYGNFNLKHIPLKTCKPVCNTALSIYNYCEDNSLKIEVTNNSNAKVRLDYYKWAIRLQCKETKKEQLNEVGWATKTPSNAIWTDCEGKLWLRAGGVLTVSYAGCGCSPNPNPNPPKNPK